MGGKITVHSAEGVGSTFLLTLPYQPYAVESPATVNRRPDADSPRLHGTVLLAEDTPILQKLERAMLEKQGLSVEVANNGKEALELASQQQYDIILMDIQMPVMDGIEATRSLRERGEKTPIVAVTANVMQKHRDEFYQAGGDAFITKPFEKSDITEVLSQYL